MDMSQYLEIFIEESKEHLLNLNSSLLELEKEPDNKTVLNEIFRVAHTLKGMSGTMGYGKMSTLTHDMEDVLDALRNNKLHVDSDMVDLLFQCLDALENYVNCISATSAEGDEDYQSIIDALGSLLKGGKPSTAAKGQAEVKAQVRSGGDSSAEDSDGSLMLKYNEYDKNVISKAIEKGMHSYEIHIELSEGCLLKAARAFIIFQILDKYSEVIKSDPSVEDIEDEKFDLSFTVMVVSKESAKLFDKELNSVAEVRDVMITEITSELMDFISFAEADKPKESSADIKTKSSKKPSKEIEKQEFQSVKNKKAGKTVRVDIDRLDVLMNLVSELIIIKTRLDDEKSHDKKDNEAIEYLERITTNLHDAVMKVRMVPVEMVFNRFPRMIRDVSKELGKDIELLMSGEETELDRTVIDEIGDPLIHILRNSADHGLESAEERINSGKPPQGHIYLRAYQDGNNVIIEVEDDGRGIDVEKVRRKIVEKGILSEEMSSNMSKKDIIDYLFAPSFSTADKVTDLSGRGVGLDVVKTKIEALGGVVEVETEWGGGSKFIIRLPLTLAIIQALLVMIGKEKYAIPLNSIKEIINITPEDIQYVRKQEVMLLRDTVIPIIRLENVLEVPRDGENERKLLTAVIVRKGEKLSGFIVDSLIGQQEIVIKSLGKLLAGIKCIAGATILGDGNVALIVDVNSLA